MSTGDYEVLCFAPGMFTIACSQFAPSVFSPASP